MPTPGTVTACFYYGFSIPDLLVRADTRRLGQAFADVPSHCAVIVGSLLYEYISTGYDWRLVETDDRAWSYAVPVPDIAGAVSVAQSGQGRYDWAEIALFVLARLVPDRWIPVIERATGSKLPNHICSLFARSVLMGGGWAAPKWLTGSDCPPSPNDMLFAVRETITT